MLYPEDFLRSLDQQRNKIVYARVTALTFDERPLEQIEGRITSGSINIDGASAVRRTCQLSVVTPEINIANYYWGLNTKIKLAIGVENYINPEYPDIIWFEQGIYVITSFSSAYSTNSYTINLSGKDKMCLLNGEISGSLSSSVDFGKIEQEVAKDENGNGIYKIAKYPVKDIIREAVHQYAGEPFHNIVINDLDQLGLELQEYRYDIPMYIWREVNNDTYNQGTLNSNQEMYWDANKDCKTIQELDENGFQFEKLISNFVSETPDIAYYIDSDGENRYVYITKIEYGETAGYKEVDLVYPDDLIANIGESITSILDKIKNFLGEFEYFYNLEGQFVFQKKRTYINETWSPIGQNESDSKYVEELAAANGYSYIFSGSEFFTSFNNTPNLANLKNDYSIWGVRKSASGGELPVHMRYAIDKKPLKYTSIKVEDKDLEDYNKKYGFTLKGQVSTVYVADDNFSSVNYLGLDETELMIVRCDWRELIFQMAADYRKYNHLDDFELRVIEANADDNLYQSGRTGYEQYYIDMEGFWRQLYNPYDGDNDTYYIELTNKDSKSQFGWARAVYEQPQTLNFWIDFLDTSGELEQFSVPSLGVRSKVANDKDVKAIYYGETPQIIFNRVDEAEEKAGYRYFNVGNFAGAFTKSARGKSAKDEIDTLLYNHGYCVESITINSIPIYYLQPNTRIYVSDIGAGIEGDYIISKISLPLSYTGSMNITATKAAQRLI